MSVKDEILRGRDEAAGWRRDFHRHPEILYDVQRTAGIVADKLRAFGCDEVAEGIGQTGVVGVIEGRGKNAAADAAIGLRADMDALPISELNDFAHKSQTSGRMHACGHDGHTAMLLAAAKYLAQTRRFAGRAALIFQPAEEGGAGGLAMVKDGLMERFGIARVFGMHNLPNLPAGEFAARPGVIMAAADFFEIVISGEGGHAAWPHLCRDPIVAASHIVSSAQTLAARETDPLDAAVISFCVFHAGAAHNVIPQTAEIQGTARALREETRARLQQRLGELCRHTGQAHGVDVAFNYQRMYSPTVNDEAQTRFAVEVARQVAGAGNVADNTPPLMGGEDFSFMLAARPGAFIFIGNGPSAGLHHPRYDFNDDIIPLGASYWSALVETALPL